MGKKREVGAQRKEQLEGTITLLGDWRWQARKKKKYSRSTSSEHRGTHLGERTQTDLYILATKEGCLEKHLNFFFFLQDLGLIQKPDTVTRNGYWIKFLDSTENSRLKNLSRLSKSIHSCLAWEKRMKCQTEGEFCQETSNLCLNHRTAGCNSTAQRGIERTGATTRKKKRQVYKTM